MNQSNNDESLSRARRIMPKRHNAKHCPFAIRERIVNALANGDSKRAIARAFRVSNNTVTAVAEQEWQQVESRKARIAAQAERAATKAFDRINDKLSSSDDIPLNTLVPVAGVSVDKLTILRGDPSLTIRHDVVLHRERQELGTLLDLIKKSNLDPAAITLEHHTNSPMQNAGIAILKAINDKVEKRAKAAVVETRALPRRDASVAGEDAAQKEG